MGGHQFEMEPIDLVAGCGRISKIWHKHETGCLIRIGHVRKFPAALLGAPFIKSYYTLFSLENRQIYFTKKRRLFKVKNNRVEEYLHGDFVDYDIDVDMDFA